MRIVDTTLIKFPTKVEESIIEQNRLMGKARPTNATLLMNVFSQAMTANEKRVGIADQRIFNKIVSMFDDLEDGVVELSNDQYKFIVDNINSASLPPNRLVPIILDFLEEDCPKKEDKPKEETQA